MDVCFLIWFLTLHAVNAALYLAVTRAAHGWAKTLLGLVIYLVAVLFLFRAFVCGFSPIWVPAGPLLSAVPFAIAVLTLLFFFPIVFLLSANGSQASRTADGERAMRLMADEVALRREAIDAARRQRHDLRHHRIVLAEHLLRGHVDKALAYLEQLDEEAAETPTDRFIWCENDTINAILSGLSRQASAKGVGFAVEANVLSKVNVPDIDLVALVANLVENAINAAGGDEQVSVILRQREQTFGMTVTNPVPPLFALSEKGLPCAEPGIGLESVRRVVERHGGELVYAVKGGVLECQAMVRLEGSVIGKWESGMVRGGGCDNCAL